MIKRPSAHLVFIKGIPILVRRCLCIAGTPICIDSSLNKLMGINAISVSFYRLVIHCFINVNIYMHPLHGGSIMQILPAIYIDRFYSIADTILLFALSCLLLDISTLLSVLYGFIHFLQCSPIFYVVSVLSGCSILLISNSGYQHVFYHFLHISWAIYTNASAHIWHDM